ncbi:MAG: tetratricopeptide repeat protein, partial [Anaerolineae bacterium]|nr:tetratricopeptide repeat protein [Anaerolineae bacterium]
MAEITLSEYCQHIEDIIEEGRYQEAIAHGKHILKQYPKYVAAYRLLGKALLEAGRIEDAADMFQRVLSADPEDIVSWVGLSEVSSQQNDLNAAAYYLERAFELAADNEAIEAALRDLYGRRDGVLPHRVELTRGALARLYLRGGLFSRATRELRELLNEEPDRVDLSVALIEALWRNGQILEASEAARKLLNELPYCIKANLILGQIWTDSGREEGEEYLRRATELDPENRMAQALFGEASPLSLQEVRITPLSPVGPAAQPPAWGVVPGPPAGVREEAALVDLTLVPETQIEIPDWLKEAIGKEAEEELPPQVEVAPETAEPLWLAGVGEVEAAPEEAEAELPPWLAGVGEIEAAPEEAEAELPPWLAGVGEIEAAPEEAEAELPPWLAGVGKVEAAPEEVPPAWLEGEEPPSGEEALAWLEQLMRGKEEELQEQARLEAEARLAEIMGRPAPPPEERVEVPPVVPPEA